MCVSEVTGGGRMLCQYLRPPIREPRNVLSLATEFTFIWSGTGDVEEALGLYQQKQDSPKIKVKRSLFCNFVVTFPLLH